MNSVLSMVTNVDLILCNMKSFLCDLSVLCGKKMYYGLGACGFGPLLRGRLRLRFWPSGRLACAPVFFSGVGAASPGTTGWDRMNSFHHARSSSRSPVSSLVNRRYSKASAKPGRRRK